MSFLAYESLDTENSYCPQEGIRCLSLNKFTYKYKAKPLENKNSNIYLINTKELLDKLSNERNNTIALLESFKEHRTSYLCCFVIKNELIANISFNVLKDYSHFTDGAYSLFTFRGNMDVIIEDIEYLKTLDIEFEFLTDTHTYTWQDIR